MEKEEALFQTCRKGERIMMNFPLYVDEYMEKTNILFFFLTLV